MTKKTKTRKQQQKFEPKPSAGEQSLEEVAAAENYDDDINSGFSHYLRSTDGNLDCI